MEYRRFGSTELKMPVMTLGCMRFQAAWDRKKRVPRGCQENLERLVGHALKQGINHMETARGYGTSEKQLGRILPHLPRHEILLQTKVGPRKKRSEFRADVEDSMKTLGVDYLDLLALHGLNNEEILEQGLKRTGSIRELIKLKEEGVVRHIGFATHGPPESNLKAIQTGLFDYVNLWYSYIYQDNWHAIQEARSRDMGVFVISPNDKGGMLYTPPPKLRKLTRPLTPMQFNDLFSLSHRQIHTLSVGAARPSDLDQHVEAVDKAKAWRRKMKAAKKRMDDAMKRAVGATWAKRYREGLPSWDETPGQINIASILWLRNLTLAYDMLEYGKMRYNLLGNAGHWFPGNKANALEELDPKALRKSLRRSPLRDQVIDALREAHRILSGEEVHRLGGEH